MDNSCAIMQPTYLPWSGYFALINRVEYFVFLDDVKIEKSSWHVRNRIKSPAGELILTIPVKMPHGRSNTLLEDVLIDDSKPWRRKHLKSIHTCYRKAPFFDEIYYAIEAEINKPESHLSKLNIRIIKAICSMLSIHSNFVEASMMDCRGLKKVAKLIKVIGDLGCNLYVSPVGAYGYLENDVPGGEIEKNHIRLHYQNYRHPEYAQLYGGFISHLSIVDLLFNRGIRETSRLIKQHDDPPLHYLEFNGLNN